MATQETTTAAAIAATIDHRESKVLLWELSRSANVFHDVFDATIGCCDVDQNHENYELINTMREVAGKIFANQRNFIDRMMDLLEIEKSYPHEQNFLKTIELAEEIDGPLWRELDKRANRRLF